MALFYRFNHLNSLNNWWHNLTSLIEFSFEISLYQILFHFSLFDRIEIKFNIVFPHFQMYFPTFLARLLTWDIGISLSKHKRFEIQMSPDPFIGFEFAFIKTMHIHHPGFHLSIKFIFFIIDFDFYDRRHWDHALHEYETYDSEKPSRSARAEFVEKENGI